jgi:phosphopentomutase
MKRAIILVMDGVGVGELPDAENFGDKGANTLLHIKNKISDFSLKNLEKMGLLHLISEKSEQTIAAFGKMNEVSPGKDSVSGHWEIAGNQLNFAFPTYPNGFPSEVLEPFTKKTGRNILGNKPASGTKIIDELAEEHIKSGDLIVYTSADSVFQIAAHEEVVPHEKLYEYCEIAREILRGEHEVGRVIARPFLGNEKDGYFRTKYRKDYSVIPKEETILDIFTEKGLETIGIGKIDDLFGGKGVQTKLPVKGNRECVKETIRQLKNDSEGIIFTNLVDFDMNFGHQRDIKGFYNELKTFDAELEEILQNLKDEDILFITADHGNDPTFKGTDHTREYVPLLVYGKNIKPKNLGIRTSFSDISKTVLEYFEIESGSIKGKSFLKEIL